MDIVDGTSEQVYIETRLHIFNQAIKANHSVTTPLKPLVLAAAKMLFLSRGYDATGMRDIAKKIDRLPVEIYRLKLSKADILAELVIELNEQQIKRIPELVSQVKGASHVDKVCAYFRELYAFDIEYLPIRSVGAAYGWTWNVAYEEKIIQQVIQLLQPIIVWMTEAELDQYEARGLGLWSVYYVGFRRAVIHGGNADDCIKEIRPTLEVLLAGGRNCERLS